jgi:two-component system cell cycle response regulator
MIRSDRVTGASGDRRPRPGVEAGGTPAADADAAARAALAAGRLAEAERLFERALSRAETSGDDGQVATLQLEIGELRFRRGDYGAARASAVAATEIFGRLGHGLSRARGALLLGRVLGESGAVELAEKRLKEAVRAGCEAGAVSIQADGLLALAQLYRRDARLPEAFRTLFEAYGVLLAGDAPDADPQRLELLETRYFEALRDAFLLVGRPESGQVRTSERVVRIARAILERLGVGIAEQVPIVLASFARRLCEYGRLDREDIDLPAPVVALIYGEAEAAPAASGTVPSGVPEGLGRSVVEMAEAVEEAVQVHGPGGNGNLTAALRQHRPIAADLLAAVEGVEWESILARSGDGPGHASAVVDPVVAPERARVPGVRRRLLVVDDDPEVRTILSDYFGAKDYAVATTSTGDGLFTLLSRVQPDLILLDIMLPGRDGRTLLERLRASLSWNHIPVIMITGIRDPNETAQALQHGADDYVEKPINPAALQARIDRLLALREALQEAERHRDRQGLLLDIIRDLTGSLDTQNLLDRLVRRVAEATGVGKCSLVLAESDPARARLALAYDNPTLHDLPLDLGRYPEIRHALETAEVVFIPDVDTHPLLNSVRREWATAVNVRSSAVIPLITENSVVGAFFIRTTWDEPPLDATTIEFAGEVAQAAGTALEYARLFERISADLRQAEERVDTYRALSMTDPLTGLANRAGLESVGNSLFASAASLDHPLSVLMLDLDNFKELNDLHGHSVGDDVLKKVSDVLVGGGSEGGLVARYGGDEFCLVLPYWQIDEVSRFGRVLCERIREIVVPDLGGASLSASLGVAAYPLLSVPSLGRLIAHADEALYRAKRGGGGHLQVTFAT